MRLSNIFKSKDDKRKECIKEEIIAPVAMVYNQLADRYSHQPFLRDYYKATAAASLIMMDYLCDVHENVFKYMKAIDNEKALSLAKLCGAGIMAMFIANPENYKSIEYNHFLANDFKASLTGSLAFDSIEILTFNNMCEAGTDFYKLSSAWVTHFYSYVMKSHNVLDASERIMIANVLVLGKEVFHDYLKDINDSNA